MIRAMSWTSRTHCFHGYACCSCHEELEAPFLRQHSSLCRDDRPTGGCAHRAGRTLMAYLAIEQRRLMAAIGLPAHLLSDGT
jgi:hypothetical protein